MLSFNQTCVAASLLGLCIVSFAWTKKITIPIGAIFKPGDKQAATAFRYQNSLFNSIETNPFSLASYIDHIDVADSFTLASQICERMKLGVFLFYGVKDMRSLDIVQSLTRTFRMPFLSPSTPTLNIKPGTSGYQINMKPETAYAIIDMITYFGWNKVIYVYDSDEVQLNTNFNGWVYFMKDRQDEYPNVSIYGLQHIQLVLYTIQAMSDDGKPFELNLRARRIYNVTNAHDELRKIDKMESNPELDTIIIFDLSSEEAYKHILRQIPEVGMNKEGYRYLVGTMEFNSIDMRRYLHGGVNITGFQLLDPDNKRLQDFMEIWDSLDKYNYPGAGTGRFNYEAALAVDAIDAITRALNHMMKDKPDIFKSTIRRTKMYNQNKTQGIPCTYPHLYWEHGDAIIEQIKMLEFEGLTGTIKFDEEGLRTDYKLDVYTVGLDNGPRKIGSWRPTPFPGFKSLYDDEEEDLREAVRKDTLIITTILVSHIHYVKTPALEQKKENNE